MLDTKTVDANELRRTEVRMLKAEIAIIERSVAASVRELESVEQERLGATGATLASLEQRKLEVIEDIEAGRADFSRLHVALIDAHAGLAEIVN